MCDGSGVKERADIPTVDVRGKVYHISDLLAGMGGFSHIHRCFIGMGRFSPCLLEWGRMRGLIVKLYPRALHEITTN